ncbi:MAG TPA: hypothetical protein VGH73_01140 [Thermoanaerobaculia bacterium]|jgi:hypothetical protein
MADLSLLGIGIYSIREAARISHVPASYIRRWLWGYKYVVKGQVHRSGPLWAPQLPDIDDARALTFRDLVEIQFVYRFRQRGISLQTIRKTIGLATELLDRTFPLSSVRFKTDGQKVFAEVIEDPAERGHVFDLRTGQYLLDYVLGYLYDALEYSKFDELVRWWPLGKDRRVIVDPKRSFGRPIVLEGVQTNILASSFRAEGDIKAVAGWFEVSESSITDALAFERSLKAA